MREREREGETVSTRMEIGIYIGDSKIYTVDMRKLPGGVGETPRPNIVPLRLRNDDKQMHYRPEEDQWSHTLFLSGPARGPDRGSLRKDD